MSDEEVYDPEEAEAYGEALASLERVRAEIHRARPHVYTLDPRLGGWLSGALASITTLVNTIEAQQSRYGTNER